MERERRKRERVRGNDVFASPFHSYGLIPAQELQSLSALCPYIVVNFTPFSYHHSEFGILLCASVFICNFIVFPLIYVIHSIYLSRSLPTFHCNK